MKNVEDIYPLSPMQEMMLLHTFTHCGNDVLLNQACYRICGRLNVAAFRQAWQFVLDRHAALRTLFLSTGLPEARQVVRRQVDVPFVELDWREQAQDSKPGLIEQLRADDRAQPFRPEQAPLIRLSLARLEEESYYLVWSSHHLVMDRWCIPVVLADLVTYYRSAIERSPLEPRPARPFSDYIRWVEAQDASMARRFWRRELAGFTGSTRLTRPLPQDSRNEQGPISFQSEIGGEDWCLLTEFCRRHHLTSASLIQGAWSLLLNSCCEAQDVVFGVVTSGRPAELPDVESIVGSFVTNLPVRVQLACDITLGNWLRALQLRLRQRLPYEYVSASQIQYWCELAPSDTLFDTLIVWLAATDSAGFPGVDMQAIAARMDTAYPVVLTIEEHSEGLQLAVQLNEGFDLAKSPEDLLRGFRSLLIELAGCEPDRQLGSLELFKGDQKQADLSSPAEVYDIEAPRAVAGDTIAGAGREQPELVLFEDILVDQWRLVLGIDQIPKDADFFDLGGDSLKAANLTNCLERVLRRRIPMLALFRAPSIQAMARVIMDQDWPITAELVTPVRDRGSLPPLFCVASPEVNTIGYSILCRYLNSERPVYVLQAAPDSSNVRRLGPPEIPVIARRYIESMRGIQLRGPYHLLGMCSGAQITIEMCRVLEQEGVEVGFVGVLDTWALYTLSKMFYMKKLIDRSRYYGNRIRKLGSMALDQRVAVLRKALNGRLAKVTRKSTPNPGVNNSHNSTVPISYSVIEEVGWATDQPKTKKITGTVTVFKQKNRQQYWRIRDPRLGWGRHAEQVDLIPLTASGHTEIFREPYVRDLARDLEACLTSH